jgi:hypothetical protein
LGGTAGALFAVQYILGVNIAVPTKPWYPCARPTLIALGETEICREPVIIAKLGIGAGGPLSTQDGWRFCSGLMFHPLAQHLDKRLHQKAFRTMKDYLAAHQNARPGLLVYTSQFNTRTQVNKALQDLGYSCCECSSVEMVDKFNIRFVWKCEENIITHVCAEGVLDPWNRPVLFAKELPRDHILYVAAQGAERAAVEKAGRVTKVISDFAPEAMCVLEVRLTVPSEEQVGRVGVDVAESANPRPSPVEQERTWR